jgi:hypothetical protein
MRTIAFLAVLTAATCCAAGEAAPETKTATLGAEDATAAAVKLVPVVEEIRGLKFKTPVPVQVVGDARARDLALARFHRFYADAELLGAQKAYVLLGLIPRGTTVVDAYLDVLREQAGGMYDPGSKALFLLDDMPKAMAPILAAHELTHALEDQHFGLDARIEATKGNDDAEFAAAAVTEGTATVLMTLYAVRALTEGTVTPAGFEELQRSEAGKGEKLEAMPEALRRPLLGSYILGASFLLRGDPARILSGGFPVEDANRVFRSGPRSSEQILHPEKYWDDAKRDEPKAVQVPDPRAALGEGFRREAGGVLGELVLGALVGAPTPNVSEGLGEGGRAWTNAAASGWGGDRWELWSKGAESVVVLETVWDTPADAEEFQAALPPARPGFASTRAADHVTLVAGPADAVARVVAGPPAR